MRVAHVGGASGFDHGSIVRREGIIPCKIGGEYLANGMKELAGISVGMGLTESGAGGVRRSSRAIAEEAG